MKLFIISSGLYSLSTLFFILLRCQKQSNVISTNLVDPASSHMLVSKIKPCMSQCKLLNGETANGSLKQL